VVVAGVDRQALRHVRVDRVEALVLLQPHRLQLRQQADPAALVALDVDEHARALLDDPVQRHRQLVAALAVRRAEDVAGQAFAVHPDQRAQRGDVAVDQRDLLGAGAVEVPDRAERPVPGRQPGFDDPLDHRPAR
jgi:hypothetical protein